MLRLLASVACLGTTIVSVAQPPFYKVGGTDVYHGNLLMAFPFAGGFNTPQFSVMSDLNGDGRDDLFVFDRSGDKAITFINVSANGRDSFIHAPQFEAGVPIMQHWAIMRDFDCDGLTDIITANGNQVRWYRATSPSTFQKVTDVLQYTDGAATKDFYINFIDIPDLVDVNGDGDLDILTFAPAGGFMEYFENQSMETFGDCAHPSFKLMDKCWGNFYESGLATEIDLDTCGPGFTGGYPEHGGELHTGSTICAFDMNADGVMEVLLGDLSFSNLNMLINGGTPSNAQITGQDTEFPSNTQSVNLSQFPAAFFLDTNADGKRDLVVSPNAKNISVDVQNTWLYRNTGSDNAPVFEFVSNDFFVKHCIDVGRHSSPVFFDNNGNGLLDIVIGNYRRTTLSGEQSASLTLYENIGTKELPVFRFVTDDFANLSSLASLYGIAPTFGDLDDDGDEDMILGHEDGRLYRFTNTAGPGNPAQFTLTHPFMSGIDVGAFSTPQLIDVNRNGLLDLIVGERNGVLTFYRNIGTKSNAVFHKDTVVDIWGGVNITQQGSLVGFSYPYLYEDEHTNGYVLLVGSDHGHIYRFNNIDGNLTGNFTLVDTMFYDIDPGERATVSGDFLNGDNSVELLIGNFRGGVELFSRSFITPVKEPSDIVADCQVYPNPVSDILHVQCEHTSQPMSEVQVEIYDHIGRRVVTAQSDVIDVTNLPQGMYYVVVRSKDSRVVTEPVVVIHP